MTLVTTGVMLEKRAMKKPLDIQAFSHTKWSKGEKKALNNEIYNIFIRKLIRIYEAELLLNTKECVQHIMYQYQVTDTKNNKIRA